MQKYKKNTIHILINKNILYKLSQAIAKTEYI